jgi:hypothetical protein
VSTDKRERDIDTSCVDCGCRKDNTAMRHLGIFVSRISPRMLYPKWFRCHDCKRKHDDFEAAASAAGMG